MEAASGELFLGRALRHGVVDGIGLLGRAEGELGLEIDLAADGDSGFPSLRDSLATLDKMRSPERKESGDTTATLGGRYLGDVPS